jgi:hypothetical protein
MNVLTLFGQVTLPPDLRQLSQLEDLVAWVSESVPVSMGWGTEPLTGLTSLEYLALGGVLPGDPARLEQPGTCMAATAELRRATLVEQSSLQLPSWWRRCLGWRSWPLWSRANRTSLRNACSACGQT